MKEELHRVTRKLNEAQFEVNKLLRQQTETVQEEISFTRLELKELLNSFYDSVVEQAVTNDVSIDLIDVGFGLDYDHRVTLDEAYLSQDFLDIDVEGFLVDFVREKNKKEEEND